MITVYHWSDGVPDASWSVKDAMIGEDTHYQACYFAGLEKPNYPMPAIPLAVIWPWQWDQEIDATNACYVTLCRVNKREADNPLAWEGSFVNEWRVF